ncbi:hypothetical protein Anapl_01312 [Anas platyrhynchos]|uniref:Uncharacterized protein n=1 Tax=Anas platyrhynchos TaxID=8839 RepID=R0K5R5_ANAPL|nr:hypothetical protein Anapl_01312 [Anas platyrhynchos]
MLQCTFCTRKSDLRQGQSQGQERLIAEEMKSSRTQPVPLWLPSGSPCSRCVPTLVASLPCCEELAAQGPVTNVCYIGTSVQSCTISGLHIQAPLLLLKQLLARLKRKQSRAAVRIA